MSDIDTQKSGKNNSIETPIETQTIQNNIKKELETSPEEGLEKILNNLKSKIDGYKEIPIDIEYLLNHRGLQASKNAENIKQKVKKISESFYGTIIKAIGKQNDPQAYMGIDYIRKAFTKNSSHYEIKDKIKELIEPLVKYHIENTRTELKKEFIINTILYKGCYSDISNNQGISLRESENQLKDSLIEGKLGEDEYKTSRLDTIANYIDNDDYNGLSEYIKEYVKNITEKYEKELSEIKAKINEDIQTYELNENIKNGTITIITGTGKIYKLTKGGRNILIGEDQELIKRLKAMGCLKEFDATNR